MSSREDRDEDARRDAIDERLARRGGCGGRGFVPHAGAPQAADPCDCPVCSPPTGAREGDTCGFSGCTGTLVELAEIDDPAELRCSICDREA